MQGSGSTAGASAYGTTSRTPRTSSRPLPPRASPSDVIDVDAINDNDGAKPPARSTSARRCWLVASAPTRPSRPLDPFEPPNYSQSAYAGSAKGKGGPSSKGGKGGVFPRGEFAGIAPSGRPVVSGGTTGLEVLEIALANWHHRLGSARESPGQLASSGMDQVRDPTSHAAGTLQAVWAPAPGRCRILSRAVLEP